MPTCDSGMPKGSAAFCSRFIKFHKNVLILIKETETLENLVPLPNWNQFSIPICKEEIHVDTSRIFQALHYQPHTRKQS